MIHHHFDSEITNSAGVSFAKTVKQELPQYDGANNSEALYNFMMKFIRHLGMNKMSELDPEMEHE